MIKGEEDMQWFKHQVDSASEADMKWITRKFGAVGYGVYWFMVERVVKGITDTDVTCKLDYDVELMALDLGIEDDEMDDILAFMEKRGIVTRDGGDIFMTSVMSMVSSSATSSRYLRGIIQKFNGNDAAGEGKKEQAGDEQKQFDLVQQSTEEVMAMNDKPKKPVRAQYPEDFEEFWKGYPKKAGKKNALREWKKLTAEEKKLAVAGIKNHTSGKELKFMKDPERYLKGAHWDDSRDSGGGWTPPVGQGSISNSDW